MADKKYVAYCKDGNELEYFYTFDEAQKWLLKCHSLPGEEIGFGTVEGLDWIAKISHRSKFTMTGSQENYTWNPIEENYENADGDIWPYGDFDNVGEVEMVEVDDGR